jgi:hypothetical protein
MQTPRSVFFCLLPVGKLRIPQARADRKYTRRRRSLMYGNSLNPCTTASLCITTVVSKPPISAPLTKGTQDPAGAFNSRRRCLP